MRNTLALLLVLATASSSALAVEVSVGGGPQAAQAAVSSINSKMDTSLAALQAQLTLQRNCSAQRKFYAPSDPKKDANSCVGVGDYDLNMASTSNVNLANGRVYSTNNASSDWGGLFYGPSNYGGVYGQAGAYGLYGVATGNGYGVVGVATANTGGVGGQFNGGSYGVQGYGGVFGVYGSAGSYGLYGYSASNYGTYGASSSGYGVTGSSSSNIGVRGDGPGSWGGYFTGQSGVLGASTNGVGVRGESTNQQGVYGYSANNWAGYFTGGNYGVYGTGSQYAGYFDGQVWVSNRLSTPTVCLGGDCRSAWPTPTAGYDDSALKSDYNWWHQTVTCGPWGSVPLRDCVWSVTNNYANWFYGWFFTAGMGSATWYNPWGNIGVWNWINNSITNMANCGYSGMVWTGSSCRTVDDYASWFRDWFFYTGMTSTWYNPWGTTGVWNWIAGSIQSIDSCGASGMVWTGSACRAAAVPAGHFGGTYTYNNGGYCYRGNPQTGGCSCPSGYSSYYGTGGFSHLDLYTCER